MEELLELLALMISAAVIHPVASPEDESLATWEFHDLLFHSRSRAGRHNYSYGNILWREDSVLPVSHEEFDGERFPLILPDLEKLTLLSPSFYQVIEDRRSIRNYGNKPIDLHQLGEFLYRVNNINEVIPSANGDLSRKPFPSAGSIYELEFYTVINNCEGLEQGVFHYSAQTHALVRVCNMNDGVQRMITISWLTATKKSNPQVLIIITARFGRVSLNYRSVAYALILKDIGVIYHHMYLVATAMKLAPCALGGGDSDLFAEVTGIDYYKESTVGEFLLGSR
jgi:SagB-type dehydrogenase family enzyme